MSATYFQDEGVEVCISDAGYNALASEQRMNHAISIHTAIFAGSAIGLIVTFAALVITKIHGA
jgi:uncharacterized membrane protein YecN with MAPEG domain